MSWSKIADCNPERRGLERTTCHAFRSRLDGELRHFQDQNKPMQTLGNPDLNQKRFRFIEYSKWGGRNGGLGLTLWHKFHWKILYDVFWHGRVSLVPNVLYVEQFRTRHLRQYINSVTSDYVAFDVPYWLSFMLGDPIRIWSGLLYVSR